MATVQEPANRYVEFDEFIDHQLEKARRGIKGTDVLAAIVGAAVLVVGYLVLFVIADHWLFADGVPQVLRFILPALVLGTAAGWLGWKVVWPYLRTVNALYAARMLENAEPGLGGTLFGLIDARGSGRAGTPEVRRALEKRAATTLATLDVETAIDRRPLLRASYVLLALVLIGCIYAIGSPKRIGPSVLRAFVPTASVGVATRTVIDRVVPGDATVLSGKQVDVTVTLRGETPPAVMLYFSTSDRRFADEPLELRLIDDRTREYRTTLTGDAGRGLVQDLTYRIEAGDASAGPYVVTVEQPPTASVTSIGLVPPSYTGLPPEVRQAPPIEAVAGTTVTLKAMANRPLRAAKLVFAEDQQFLTSGWEVPLSIKDGSKLSATWTLDALRDNKDAEVAFSGFYRIELRDTDGKTNPNPPVYPITIRPDRKPEVMLADPRQDIEKPANAVIPLLLTARDPDFLLRELTLHLEKNGQELPQRVVLWEGQRPEVSLRYDWELAPLNLNPGDVLTYYIQARDNREPEFNRSNTARLRVTITEPVTTEEVQKQLEEDRRAQEEPPQETDGNPNGEATDHPQRQDAGTNDQNPEQQGEPDQPQQSGQPNQAGDEGGPQNDGDQAAGERQTPRVRNDGAQDDEVLQKLIDKRREQDQKPQDQTGQEGEAGNQKQDGQQQGGQQQGGQQQGGQQQGGQQGAGQQKNGGQSGAAPQAAGTPSSGEGGTGQSGASAGQPGAPGEARSPQTGKAGDPSGMQAGGPSDGQPAAGEAASNSDPAREQPAGNNAGNSAGQPDSTAPAEGATDKPGAAAPKTGDSNNPALPESGEKPPAEAGAGNGMTPPATGDGAAKPQAADGQQQPQPGKPGTATDGQGAPADENGETMRAAEPSDTPQASREGEGNTPPGTTPPANAGQPNAGQPNAGQPGAEQAGQQSGTAGDAATPDTAAMPKQAQGQPGAAETPGDSAAKPAAEGANAEDREQPEPGNAGAGQLKPDGTPDGQTTSGQAAQKSGGQSPAGDPAGQGDSTPKPGQPPGGQGKPSDQPPKAPPGSAPQAGRDGNAGEGQPPAGDQGGSQPNSQSNGNGQTEPGGSQNPPKQGMPSGEPPQGQDQQGQGQPGQGQPGQGQPGQGQPGQGQPGQGQPGQGQPGQGQPGQGQQGQGQQGQGQQGQGQQGQGQQGQGQQGQGQQGQGQQGQGQQGQGQQGQGQQGQGQQGQGQQGQGQQGQQGQGGSPGGNPAGGGGGAAAGGGNDTPDVANADYARQTTDLVLQKLEDDLKRGEVDQQLLKELGWTQGDMQKFADRMRDQLAAPPAEATPQDQAQREEFEQMLEHLRLDGPPPARSARTDRSTDVENLGPRNGPVPTEYRDAYDAFTRSVARQRQAAGE